MPSPLALRRSSSTLALLMCMGAVAGCTPHSDTSLETRATENASEAVTNAATPTQPPEPVEPSPPLCPRRGGQLRVACDPPPLEDNVGLRLRSFARGCLSIECERTWMGEPPPAYVPLNLGSLELTLLEHDGASSLAVYRDPYGGGSCDLSKPDNCRFVARIYDHYGAMVHEHELSAHFSRPDQLELQDARYVDGVIYFNEACQTYSDDANGQCSALIAVDAATGALSWRTRNLVSNGYFAVLDDFVAVNYGFTSERARLSLIDKRTGEVAWTQVGGRGLDHMHRVNGRTIRGHQAGRGEVTYEVRDGELHPR